MGHDLEEPLQVSATSHEPFLVRHTVLLEATASEGQAAEEPVQVSARSHTPLAARQL